MREESSENITMPKWPAYVMLGIMGLCTYPVLTAASLPATPAVSAPAPTAPAPIIDAIEPKLRCGQ